MLEIFSFLLFFPFDGRILGGIMTPLREIAARVGTNLLTCQFANAVLIEHVLVKTCKTFKILNFVHTTLESCMIVLL